MQRNQRLRQRRAFDAVFREGVHAARGVLAVRAREREDDEPSRFGFSVSSRLGGATVRNRIKRRLREAARRIDARGYDIVVVARSGAERASYNMLHDSLRELVQTAARRSRTGGGRDR